MAYPEFSKLYMKSVSKLKTILTNFVINFIFLVWLVVFSEFSGKKLCCVYSLTKRLYIWFSSCGGFKIPEVWYA